MILSIVPIIKYYLCTQKLETIVCENYISITISFLSNFIQIYLFLETNACILFWSVICILFTGPDNLNISKTPPSFVSQTLIV